MSSSHLPSRFDVTFLFLTFFERFFEYESSASLGVTRNQNLYEVHYASRHLLKLVYTGIVMNLKLVLNIVENPFGFSRNKLRTAGLQKLFIG